MLAIAPAEMVTTEALPAVPLQPVVDLCLALDQASIRYCHWKSNNALAKSATGDNDLDLLVARADSLKFAAVLSECGFKLAFAPPEKQMPGVQDYFGYDAAADKWVHVHAHYQLIAGHDLSKNYRLPIEEAYLGSAVRRGMFTVPAPEFEYIVFVVRMTLKHLTWDAIVGREGRLKQPETEEFIYLQTQAHQGRIEEILQRHLPYIDVGLFRRCVEAMNSRCSIWRRLTTARQLQTKLRGCDRRAWPGDTAVKLVRRVTSAVRWRLRGGPRKYRLATGGMAIALVGGDGAGKSTAVDGLRHWLSEHFDTRCAHLGKPPWSTITVVIRGFLKIGHWCRLYGAETSMRDTLAEQSIVWAGYPWLLREICRARDRCAVHIRARRHATKGGFVIFDRFPCPQITLMDGPLTRQFLRKVSELSADSRLLRLRAESRMTNFFVQVEENCYRQIAPPDLLIVLRVDPDTAVQRKPEDKECDVRERSMEVWKLNWQPSSAHVVDGAKSKADVVAELKALIWSHV